MTASKASYYSINKLCDKIYEAIYDSEKHVFKPGCKDTSGLYILIVSNDNIYDDRFNKNMVVCKPKALSIYDKQYMDYKELCKLLNVDKLYLKINRRFIEFRNKMQVIEIESENQEFTNQDGEEIEYHNTQQLTGIFYRNVIKEYQKFIANKSK